MDNLPYYYLVFLILIQGHGEGRDDYCKVSTCGPHGPAIRFPFWLRIKQPESCGYPGFELSCNDMNQTVLNLPHSVKVVVKKIDYKSQVIHLYDPNNCLPKLFPSINLSTSRFDFMPSGHSDFVLIKCSPRERKLRFFVPCLSDHEYQVYADFRDSILYDLTSCVRMHDISSVTADIFLSNELQLNWKRPNCSNCEAKGKLCSWKNYNSYDANTAAPQLQCLHKGSSKKKLLVTGLVLGTTSLVLVVVALYRSYISYKSKKDDAVKIETFLEDYKALKPTRYTFTDIKKITNQFKDKLGEGGYGTVFKGKLSSEIMVAVKVLRISIGNGEEFINEVGTMGRIHHVNVVRLVGFCADGTRQALVYEFLPNKSLEKYIFSEDEKYLFLGWDKLQDIATGIARGIEYLHQGCDHQILHFDIKPHNILLDHDFNPKIADFGLAKLCSKEQSIVSMTAARGTMGYIAPEVFSRNFGNVSYKSDIYSFGMMLLEMVGGRKNIDVTVRNTSQTYFPEWIYNRLRKGEDLGTQIEEEEHGHIAKKLAIVGLWCIQWYPVDRPSTKTVIQMLEGKVETLTTPPDPFASKIQNTTSIQRLRTLHRGLEIISETE